MLAEVVVVAVVIATILVTLFTGINNVSSSYEIRNKYYDVDSMYAAIEINEILKRKEILVDNYTTTKKLNSSVASEIDNYKNFYSSATGDDIKTYITTYSISGLDTLIGIIEQDTRETFSDYANYLKNNLDFNDESYNYMIIVERREEKDFDDCYYYALKLKY